MKRRLLIPLVAAGLALTATAGVASANPSYWRQNGLLLEVSADPRDGTDFVQTDATHAQSLELVALNDTVFLRSLTVRFADGRALSQRVGPIRPGQRVDLALPAHCAAIVGVELEYGRQRYDRTPARLQIIPRNVRHGSHYSRYDGPAIRDHRYDSSYYGSSYYQTQPTYTAPRPVYVQPRPTYVQPRSGWTIEGSFRF